MQNKIEGQNKKVKKTCLPARMNAARKYFMLRIKQIGCVLLFGLPVAFWLAWRDKKAIYFLPHVGLGDYCIALGYLKAYKEQHNLEHVTLIIPPNRIEVANYYPYWDDKLILPDCFYVGIAYLGSLPGGMAILKKFPRIVSITYTLYSNKQLLDEHPAAKADELVKLILALPQDEIRLPPAVPYVEITTFIEKYCLKQKKTVLLNPYTGGCAVKEIDLRFYQTLAARLQQEGYTVATILGSKKQQTILGTQGIVSSLSEAWYLVQWCGWVIGTRSGFFDFIQYSGCNMIAIDDGTYRQRDVFSLPQSNNTTVKEYIWSTETEHLLIDKIISDLVAC